MLTIRREQVDALDRVARERFLHRLAAYLRQRLPEETVAYDDKALLAYVEASERRAARRRIETEYGIAQWACVALILGFYFDDHPSVDEYFSAPSIDPEDKLEVLVDGLNEALLDPHRLQD